MFNPGDIVVVDFPGITGIKRRPAVVLSSDVYHSSRPDVIVGLITSHIAVTLGPTDYALQDWAAAGLRIASSFRGFFATLPLSAHHEVVGHLSECDWKAVRACVKAAFAPLDDLAPPFAPTV